MATTAHSSVAELLGVEQFSPEDVLRLLGEDNQQNGIVICQREPSYGRSRVKGSDKGLKFCRWSELCSGRNSEEGHPEKSEGKGCLARRVQCHSHGSQSYGSGSSE